MNTWQLLVHIHARHSNALLRPSFTPPSPSFRVHTFSRCILATKCICCATLPSIKSHWESVQDAVLRSRGSERWCCVHWSRGSDLHGVHCTLEWEVLLPLRHRVSGGSEVATPLSSSVSFSGEGGTFCPLGEGKRNFFPLLYPHVPTLTILYPTLTPSFLPPSSHPLDLQLCKDPYPHHRQCVRAPAHHLDLLLLRPPHPRVRLPSWYLVCHEISHGRESLRYVT